METSEDESSSTIDSFPEIIVYLYRLTDFGCTPPLYISHTALTFFTFLFTLMFLVVSLKSPEGRDYL